MEGRLDETMKEANRHFESYLKIRNQLNAHLEGKLPGGVKGARLNSDILSTLKTNLMI